MKRSLTILASLPVFALALQNTVYAEVVLRPKQSSAEFLIEEADSLLDAEGRPDRLLPIIDPAKFKVRDIDEILSELPAPESKYTPINKVFGPWVFSGYRHVAPKRNFTPQWIPVYPGMTVATNDSAAVAFEEYVIEGQEGVLPEGLDSISFARQSILLVGKEDETPSADMSVLAEDYIPSWLRNALTQYRIQEDFMYENMIDDYRNVEYAYWDLPVPPRLADDDSGFMAYLSKLDLPVANTEQTMQTDTNTKRIHWLHTFNASAQFSQAYVSSNWYQGGNNNLALRMGAVWNVQLNQVYHPKLLFQSNLSYWLGLNSTPQDVVHSYSISEDILQWNLNAGVKAFREKWYYSLTAQFKTQLFRNYVNNSDVRKASFLSPGDFNLGLGMSYSTKTKKIQLTTSIAPLSYNLKTCISKKINHSQFNIPDDAYTHSEIGSSAEVNLKWQILWNISYSTRMFLFTNYKYFLADWENTFNFEINKFLSSQIYVHARYDSSTETNTKWKHFMLREVLSFGLSYTFSTK